MRPSCNLGKEQSPPLLRVSSPSGRPRERAAKLGIHRDSSLSPHMKTEPTVHFFQPFPWIDGGEIVSLERSELAILSFGPSSPRSSPLLRPDLEGSPQSPGNIAP